MAIGIVSDEEFLREIENCAHKDITRGRGSVKEIPESIREIIAEDAILSDHSGKETAEKFGVSTSSVSAYKHGATSTTTYDEPNNKLQRANDKIRTDIVSTARARLISALAAITPEKLENAKVRDVASVAKDMSAVIHNTEPTISNTNIGAQFVFHVPQQKKESDYEIIDISN